MVVLREHVHRAQVRIKRKSDCNRTEREFMVGDEVLLKLQPYAKDSAASRPCAKLAGIQVLRAVQGATMRPPSRRAARRHIHLVFHV